MGKIEDFDVHLLSLICHYVISESFSLFRLDHMMDHLILFKINLDRERSIDSICKAKRIFLSLVISDLLLMISGSLILRLIPSTNYLILCKIIYSSFGLDVT